MASEAGGNGLQQDTPVDPAGAPPEVELWRTPATEREETIRFLKDQLTAEAEERRKLIAILTDQRRRPWWRRWFR
jgi:hypothetical protein